MLDKLLLVFMVLFTSACIKIRDPKKEAEEGQVSPQVFSNVIYEVEPLPEYQKYQVTFKNLSTQTLVRRYSASLKDKPVEVDSLIDVVDQAGLVEYRLSTAGHEQTVKIEIPNDVLIEGQVGITSLPFEEVKNSKWAIDKKINIKGRLFFKSKSRLVTEGWRVMIEADTIHVENEGAAIYTRIDSTIDQKENRDGHSGGTIYFRAKSLTGWLHFVMRGQNGASGGEFSIKKRPQDRRSDGFDGGNSGALYVEIQDMRIGKVTYESRPGSGGPGVPILGPSYKPGKFRTIKPKGKDGENGLEQAPCLLIKGNCEKIERLD